MVQHIIKTLIIAIVAAAPSMAGDQDEKVVWNGDDIGKNKTWATQSTVEFKSKKMKIHFTGKEWSGMGLNWAGYWPKDAGVAIKDYKYFVVELKVGEGGQALEVTLTNNKHKKSCTVKVAPYMPKGKFTKKTVKVKIPIKDLIGDKGAYADSKVWEVMVSIWSQGEKDVCVTINEFAFAKE